MYIQKRNMSSYSLLAIGALFDSEEEVIESLEADCRTDAVYKSGMCIINIGKDGKVILGHHYMQPGDCYSEESFIKTVNSQREQLPEKLRHRLHIALL